MINVADGGVLSPVDCSLPHSNDVRIEQRHESEVHLLTKVCTIQLVCYNDIYDNLSDISVVFKDCSTF
jgi:methylthioribose-1-phosphate isomerase